MAGMSTYPFKCDLCGGVTDAPTYGDFNCQRCGQAYVYDECHQIKLSERQLKTLRDSRWIPVSEQKPDADKVVFTDGKNITIATRYESGAYDAWDVWEKMPTHWMPIPEPPEAK